MDNLHLHLIIQLNMVVPIGALQPSMREMFSRNVTYKNNKIMLSNNKLKNNNNKKDQSLP